jgi:hypothetical protein
LELVPGEPGAQSDVGADRHPALLPLSTQSKLAPTEAPAAA